VGGGENVDAGVMRGLERAPLVLRQSMQHGRQGYVEGWMQRVGCSGREARGRRQKAGGRRREAKAG
jgi:hypothetical protein